MKESSQACQFLDTTSWEVRKVISGIHIGRLLSEAEISVLHSTKKIFANIALFVYSEDHLESLLDQISTIPTLKLDNLHLVNRGFEKHFPILKRYKKVIKKIQLDLCASYAEAKHVVTSMKSMLPDTNISVKLDLIDDGTEREIPSLDELNVVELLVSERASDLMFHSGNYKVKRITCLDPNPEIICFQNLQELKIDTCDLDLLKRLLEINRKTLMKLEILNDVSNWDYALPCDLKQVHLGKSDRSSKILENQGNLRSVSLENNLIKKDLLDIFSVNKSLTEIDLVDCEFESSANDFNFLEHIKKLRMIYSLDFPLIKAIFSKCKKNTFVYFSGLLQPRKDADLDYLKNIKQEFPDLSKNTRQKYNPILKEDQFFIDTFDFMF